MFTEKFRIFPHPLFKRIPEKVLGGLPVYVFADCVVLLSDLNQLVGIAHHGDKGGNEENGHRAEAGDPASKTDARLGKHLSAITLGKKGK